MAAVLLVIHSIVCVALIVTVLLQRSEGGALGIGGGAGGGLMSGRGVANALVRTTMALAAVFFITSLFLTRQTASTVAKPSEVEREIERSGQDVFSQGSSDASGDAAPETPAPETPAADPLSPPSADPLSPPASSGDQPAAPADPLAPEQN
ncbi:MAG: preprotein translocase subunit SecG [Hyphomonadaceae bacterium]